MSEDLAFRIQLGIVLPKLKEKIGDDLGKIVNELVDILVQGTLGDEEITLEPIKEIIMKDLEIFLDENIMPAVEKKIAPPQEEEPPADEAAEGEGEKAAEDE